MRFFTYEKCGRVLCSLFFKVNSMNEVYRQEKKFLINKHEIHRLMGRLDRIMMQDSHNGAAGYVIRSLYFDTINDRDYEEKLEGIELRRKIRIRTYSADADFAMLEMKQKEGQYQKKRSLRLSAEDAAAVIKGRYHVLLGYDSDFAAECYGLMNRMCYRPATVVEYRRKAYIAKENRIRVTIDHEIRANEVNMNIFDRNMILYPVMDPYNGVLEVKYNGFLLSYIKDALNDVNRSELSVSKYCLARMQTKKFGF